MINVRRRETGSALIICLVMLAVTSLLLVSTIDTSMSNLKVIGAMQAKKSAEDVAQLAIEQVMGSIDSFSSPTAPVTVSVPSGYTASVADRICTHSGPAPSYSAVSGVSPDDTFWRVSVTVSDSTTGANVTMNQGVKIRMLPGGCV